MGKSLKLIVEALLFSSEKPLTVKDIHSCLPDAGLADIRSAQHEVSREQGGTETSRIEHLETTDDSVKDITMGRIGEEDFYYTRGEYIHRDFSPEDNVTESDNPCPYRK